MMFIKEAINNKDFDKAFNLSHALKGVYANLSITPLYEMLYDITEDLRVKKGIDYTNQINKIVSIYEDIKRIINN